MVDDLLEKWTTNGDLQVNRKEDCLTLLNLLKQVCVISDHPNRPNHIIVPCLLSQERRPDAVENAWKLRLRDPKANVVGRQYRIPFYPYSTFDGLFKQIPQSSTEPVIFWKDGMQLVRSSTILLLELIHLTPSDEYCFQVKTTGPQYFGKYISPHKLTYNS